MYIKKAQAGSAPRHTWTEDGQVLHVEDALAEELLLIPNGGFTIAEEPKPEPELTLAEQDAAETAKRKGGRPTLPRDADGNIIRD